MGSFAARRQSEVSDSSEEKLKVVTSREAFLREHEFRYWSNVPFGHGELDTAEFSAIPSTTNFAYPLVKNNPTALQDELIRHITKDKVMSTFDLAVQLLNPSKMTYWGRRYDASFGLRMPAFAGRKQRPHSMPSDA